MSFLARIGQVFKDLASDYREHQDAKRAHEAYLAERQARIARGESPPSFRNYEEYLQSDWWHRLRSHTLTYLSHKCEFCGGHASHVHHVRYPRFRSLGSENIKSIYAVCARCHDIAHGLAVRNDELTCAFCQARATIKLSVAFRRHTRSHQPVCARCDSLANGYRAQAENWTKAYYEAWVEGWHQSIPPLYPALIEREAVQRDVRDIEKESSLFKEKVSAHEVRKLELAEREQQLSLLSTEELRRLWESREQLQEDECRLLRSLIRKRYGHE